MRVSPKDESGRLWDTRNSITKKRRLQPFLIITKVFMFLYFVESLNQLIVSKRRKTFQKQHSYFYRILSAIIFENFNFSKLAHSMSFFGMLSRQFQFSPLYDKSLELTCGPSKKIRKETTARKVGLAVLLQTFSKFENWLCVE